MGLDVTTTYTVALDGSLTEVATETTENDLDLSNMTDDQKIEALKAIFGESFDFSEMMALSDEALIKLVTDFLSGVTSTAEDTIVVDDDGSDTTTTTLQEQINALKSKIQSLEKGEGDGETEGLDYDGLIAKIQEMFTTYNSAGYDPAAYLNAFGFAMVPNADGSFISMGSDNGMYYRKAVKDRDTGKIRYINVPINSAGVGMGGGISNFRAERRTGFGDQISV